MIFYLVFFVCVSEISLKPVSDYALKIED